MKWIRRIIQQRARDRSFLRAHHSVIYKLALTRREWIYIAAQWKIIYNVWKKGQRCLLFTVQFFKPRAAETTCEIFCSQFTNPPTDLSGWIFHCEPHLFNKPCAKKGKTSRTKKGWERKNVSQWISIDIIFHNEIEWNSVGFTLRFGQNASANKNITIKKD